MVRQLAWLIKIYLDLSQSVSVNDMHCHATSNPPDSPPLSSPNEVVLSLLEGCEKLASPSLHLPSSSSDSESMDTDASTRTNEMEGHARSANTCSALIQSSPQPSDVDMDQGEEVGTVGTVCSAESTKLRLPTAPFSPIAPTADLHSLDMELDFAPAPTCTAPVQPLPRPVPSGSNNTSTHEEVEKLVASGSVASPSATDYTPWNRPSSPIAPVSIPLDVDDDDTVSIPDSPVVASPEIQLYPDTAGIHLGGGETSAHSHDVSETPSKFLKMVLLSVSETWPVIQHSLFKLFPPKCISGIIHIVQTVTISGQIIWMAAASIDATVMLRGYLVD